MTEITFSQVVMMMLQLAVAANCVAAFCGFGALLWMLVFLVFRLSAWVDARTR